MQEGYTVEEVELVQELLNSNNFFTTKLKELDDKYTKALKYSELTEKEYVQYSSRLQGVNELINLLVVELANDENE